MFNNVTSISGPVSLYIYYNNNKKYYFFGDIHFGNKNTCEEQGILCDHYDEALKNVIITGTNCTDMGALLHHWFTFNNDYGIITDFYAETPFTKEKERVQVQEIIEDYIIEEKPYTVFPYENESWLTLIADIMSPCFLREKKGCPYFPNVRSHYSDLRYYEIDNEWLDVNIYNTSDLFDYLVSLNDNYSDVVLGDYERIATFLFEHANQIINIFMDTDNYDENVNILWKLVGGLQDEYIKELYTNKINNLDYLLVTRENDRGEKQHMHRIAYNLYKLHVKNPVMADAIEEYIRGKVRHDADMYLKDWIENQKYLFGNDIVNQNKFISFYNESLIIIGSYIMDIYTLARMFEQDDSKQIIVYAGDAHVLTYAEFFEDYLKAIPQMFIENTDRSKCLQKEDLNSYLNVNKFRIHSYYKPHAINIIERNEVINVGDYKEWYNVVITRNQHKAFRDLFTVTFKDAGGKKYEKSWNQKDVINFLIQYMYYNKFKK